MNANRDLALHAYSEDLLDEEEFLLLYDVNKSNLHFPYKNYPRFELANMTNDECIAEFRFEKNHLDMLCHTLQIPEIIRCYNGTVVSGIEGLCIFLKRFSYPCRYSDMIHRFGRPVPELCMISNNVLNFIYERWDFLLTSMDQQWLTPENLQHYADVVHEKGAPLENCWGFIDGTVRPICRPGHNQRVVYNGHKRVHSLKFQSVVAPNGLISNLYGAVEGRRHDSGMLGDSNLLTLLQQHAVGPENNILCLYGDPAYPLRPQLMGPYKGANVTQMQREWNKEMM